MFVGYTIILLFDKVLFDTHSLFDDHDHGENFTNDPAARKLQINLSKSAEKVAEVDPNDKVAVKKSMAEQREDVEDAVKSYLTPTDRFATRMKASLSPKNSRADQAAEDQKALFVDSNNIDAGSDSK